MMNCGQTASFRKKHFRLTIWLGGGIGEITTVRCYNGWITWQGDMVEDLKETVAKMDLRIANHEARIVLLEEWQREAMPVLREINTKLDKFDKVDKVVSTFEAVEGAQKVFIAFGHMVKWLSITGAAIAAGAYAFKNWITQ